MRQIIDGQVFDGKAVPGEYVVSFHELGNGQRECTIRQVIGWEHVHTLTPEERAYFLEKYGTEDGGASAEERRQANLERAARRAKTNVRRRVKSMGLDSLLTLTYRANVVDLDLAKRHLKEFVRRMRRLVPGFAYVAAWEQQKRGAWHAHLAVHRLPLSLPASNGVKVKSYSVVRAVWRSVTGELGGNIDQSRRRMASGRSPARLAAYLSKYMVKAFEAGDAWSNRYSASSHSLPPAVRETFRGAALTDLIALAYAFAADGSCQVDASWLSRFGDTFYLATEPPGGYRSIHCR